VPVVTDLKSGIPEVVRQGLTGYRASEGDVGAFADAIFALARDRARLEEMSAAIRSLVANEWDIRVRAAEYQSLFEQWPDLRRARDPHRQLPYGSRLDRRWLPNPIVRAIRTMTRRFAPIS